MPLNVTPEATDRVSNTQAPIKENFDLLQAWSIVNHTDVANTKLGWHTNLTFPVALAAESPLLTADTQIAMLPFTGTISGKCELAIKKFGATSYTFTEATQAATGWTRDASGILYKWGLSTLPSSGATLPITLTGIGPAYTAVYNSFLNTKSGGADTYAILKQVTLVPATLTVKGFGVKDNGSGMAVTSFPGGIDFFWITIGV